MATKMGIREFRDNFTAIARDATEPVIVTNHDKVVGWFTPAKREPPSLDEMFKRFDAMRARLEARGIDVDKRLSELGIREDEEPKQPARRAPRRKAKRK